MSSMEKKKTKEKIFSSKWEELQQLHPLMPNLSVLKHQVEEDITFKIFARFVVEYGVRIYKVMIDAMPPFNRMCAIIHRKETRDKVMSKNAGNGEVPAT